MAGGQNLGEAVLKITLDTKTLKTQLDQLKKDIEEVQAGPVKLKPDGTSTRSKTTPADTAAKKAAADEARRVASLNALEARRFRIGRELNKLEERGVNISRLRSKLESNTLRRSSSQAEITSAREQTRSLERQVALRKDLADKEKRANAAKKDTTTPTPPAEAVKPAAVTDPRSVQRSLRNTRVDLTNLRRKGGDTNLAAESFNAAVEASQKGQLKNARDLIAETRTRIKEERSLLDAINDQGQAAANVGKPKGESNRLLTDINTNKSRLLRQNPGANLTEIDAKQAQAVDAAGKGQSAVVRRLKGEIDTLIRAERERLAGLKATTTELGKQKPPGGGGGGGGGGPTGPNGPTRPPRKPRISEEERALQLEAKAKQKRRDGFNKKAGDIASNTLIGGGFPLLFGQGAGAAAGGAIGGLAGGAIGGGFGFALSIVGTAIGAAFDEMLAKGKVLALGLDDPISQFEALKEASLFSNLGVEKNVGALIKGGRTEEAKLIAQDDLTKRFGDTASLDAYIKSQDELNRAWAEASIAVAQFTSGPLAAFLADLAKGLGGGSENAERVRVNTAMQDLGPKGTEDFVKFARKRGVRLDDKGSLDNGLFGDPDNLRKGFEARKAFVQSRGFVDPEIKRQQEVEAQIRNARQQYLKQEQRRLKINALSISGNKLGAIDEQIDVVNEDRRSKIASLARTASPVERENINRQADGEIAKLSAEKLKIQNDLNQALANEAIIRRGIAQQITASVAQQGAALARGDSAANPGNKVLAARAGDAEARAFLEQNRQGVNSARSAEAQLQNQIKFEVDPSKIAELQSKLATAAQATKLAMVEAGTALASKAADAAASLQGAREGLRGLLENNIDKLPGQAQVDLKRSALGDVQRGIQSGILRPNINFNNTKSLLENASFVRQVEVARAQVSAAEAQIEALKENTVALLTPGAINVTINSDGAGGWQSGGAERVAA